MTNISKKRTCLIMNIHKQINDTKNIKTKKEYLYLSGIHMFKYLMMNIFKYTPYESQYDKTYSEPVLKDIKEYYTFTRELLEYEKILIEENSKKILLPFAKISFNSNRFYEPKVRNMSAFWDDEGIKYKSKSKYRNVFLL